MKLLQATLVVLGQVLELLTILLVEGIMAVVEGIMAVVVLRVAMMVVIATVRVYTHTYNM